MKRSTASGSPALDRAFAFLTLRLSASERTDAGRLPSLGVLARRAGVSRNTMWKAVGQAKLKKLLHVTPGGFIEAAAAAAKPDLAEGQTQDKRGVLWQKTRALLEHELMTGVFGLSGRVPSTKELASRYGVCFRTIQKIVRSLVKDGVVIANGRKRTLPESPRESFRSRIVFITCRGHFAQVSALNQEYNRIINLFENECVRMGLGFETIEIDFYDAAEARQRLPRLNADAGTAGFVVDVWWYVSAPYRQSYLDLIDRLALLNRPVSLLDELGNFDLPIRHCANPLLQVYSIEGARAGERMARHLTTRGHRSVAFVSALTAHWSTNRLAGIANHVAQMGSGFSLVSFAAEEAENAFEGSLHLFAASKLSDEDVRRLIRIGRTPAQARDMESRWVDFVKSGGNKNLTPSHSDRELSRNLAGIGQILRYGYAPDFLRKATNAVIQAAADRVFPAELVPLFEKTLRCTDVTAWICSNDMTAFEALAFLRSRRVRVPQEISVVGFDNVPAKAIEQGLTTLDFNAVGFVNQMMGFILRPPRPRGAYRHRTIEVEGIVMERASSSAARSR